MKVLTLPALIALLALGLAAGLHPASPILRWAEETPVAVPALCILLVICFALRARMDLGRALVFAGAAGVVLALAYDQVEGHWGVLALRRGEAQGSYDERDGRDHSLGLRPFGFTVGLESVSEAGAVLAFSGASGEVRHPVSAERAAGHQGYRFAWQRVRATGEAESLEIGVSDGTGELRATLAPARSVELSVSRQPAAWALGLAVAVAAIGVALRKEAL